MLTLKRWGTDLLNLLFPNLCNACGIPLYHNENVICTKCRYHLPYTDYHLYDENRVAKQFWGRIPLNAAMAMLYFRKGSKTQNLIHNLKYNAKTEVGTMMGTFIGDRLKANQLYADIDLIVPVPLHAKKLRSRGYNQSAFIAQGISAALMVSVCENALIRKVATESQTKKSRYNRYENMLLVFTAKDPAIFLSKHILLVDDVITTGATLEACASLMLSHGAAKVSVAAIAFAE